MTSEQRPAAVKVVVATTVMLSFISFWRAAARASRRPAYPPTSTGQLSERVTPVCSGSAWTSCAKAGVMMGYQIVFGWAQVS